MCALGSPIEYEPNRGEDIRPFLGSRVKLRNGEIQQAGVIVVLLCTDFTWQLGLYKHFFPRKSEKFSPAALSSHARAQGWRREPIKRPRVTYCLSLPLRQKMLVCPATPAKNGPEEGHAYFPAAVIHLRWSKADLVGPSRIFPEPQSVTTGYIFPTELLEEFLILLLLFLFRNFLRQQQVFKNPFNKKKKKSAVKVF